MRDSINRKFIADYMKYAENYGLQEAIKQGGGAGEDMVNAHSHISCIVLLLITCVLRIEGFCQRHRGVQSSPQD